MAKVLNPQMRSYNEEQALKVIAQKDRYIATVKDSLSLFTPGSAQYNKMVASHDQAVTFRNRLARFVNACRLDRALQARFEQEMIRLAKIPGGFEAALNQLMDLVAAEMGTVRPSVKSRTDRVREEVEAVANYFPNNQDAALKYISELDSDIRDEVFDVYCDQAC